ncbi:PTS sugar transporter subunit IIA [Clostridium beijerinckii]|uniref:PTS transporter subunit EIIA n=1 Tax=Clostridium beijerinckii TaxID=1520 RepID=A0AAW3W4T0_CLOBE|nr:fructose PTS transporter subunit IIA [Clostridium beijerinckii]MBC2456095.1 PTS transporter subunit EIIA [Clostridium beijerinckii]MBC2473642.1 PTS transporter subunit EIIA [Clostridium beijerinckii]NOV62983.1 fructose-specific phosphotransferase system IIA component [Clostridium beijerinckii]NOV70055.1 fructose-specific phosphotransferase system IIA component [Clostridium beijerinckii]NOW31038.1 fructose-specific phosphotransferase system IIA component [Clostridium beijerinckii]
MNITEMITINTVEFNLNLKTQKEVLEKITDILFKDNRIINKEETLKGYIDRESECTTGIGFGLAIPHCKVESVIEPTIVCLKLNEAVDWNSLDEEPVNIIVGLAIPKKYEGTLHLEILGRLASNLMEDDFKYSLFNINDKNKLVAFLQENLSKEEE